MIDYYVGDGKERTQELIKTFLKAAKSTDAVGSAEETRESLRAIHDALNATDPHFIYDFAVDTIQDPKVLPIPHSVPGMVISVQYPKDHQVITVKIIARYDSVTDDRKVPGGFTFSVEPGSADQKAVEDFFQYGKPLKDFPAQDIFIDLPGDFGTSGGEGVLSVGPGSPPTGPAREVTFQTFDEAGEMLAQLDFVTEEMSAGLAAQGIRGAGRDALVGVVSYELLLDSPTNHCRLNLTFSADLDGLAPADALSVIRFIDTVRTGSSLQLFIRNGPELMPRMPAPNELITKQAAGALIVLCEILARIQRHTIQRITIPNLDAITNDDVSEWEFAARILEGKTVPGTWAEMSLTVDPGVVLPDGPCVFRGSERLSVRIGQTDVDLGFVETHLGSVRLDPARPPQEHEDSTVVWVVPSGDNTALRKRVSEPAIELLPASDESS